MSRNETDPRQRVTEPQLGPGASGSPVPTLEGAELEAWNLIKDSARPQDFRDHLARFRLGASKQMALDRLAALEEQAYRRAIGETKLREFLKQFPDSTHCADVSKRLARQVAANKRQRPRAGRSIIERLRAKPPVEQRLRGFLAGAYICACIAAFVLLVTSVESMYGSGSPESAFVPTVYAAAFVVAGLIGERRLAAGLVASTEHLGFWKARLAIVGGAVGWLIITYVLMALIGNLVEFGRVLFVPAVAATKPEIGVLDVGLAALAAFALQQWLVKRLNSPNKVFISYRRDDGAAIAARIGDRLRFAIGRRRVFMDRDDIRPGQQWEQELHKTLAQCTVLIAIIGRNWMDLLGQRMKTGERDYVREEIAAALGRGLPVVPVLVEGAELPDGHLLPSNLRDLVRYQIFNIADDHRFGRDVDDLAAAVRKSR